MNYRWLFLLLIVGIIGTTVWLGLPKAPAAVRISEAGAEFKLPGLQGSMHGLPRGEVTLLNFWATWCPPCRKEIPSMTELHRKFKDRGLKIVAVSVDKSREHLASFVREQGMPFQVLHDADSAVSHAYGVYRYPESFLIDKRGKVRYHLLGAVEWMSPPLLDTIDDMLAEPPVQGSVSEERENSS